MQWYRERKKKPLSVTGNKFRQKVRPSSLRLSSR